MFASTRRHTLMGNLRRVERFARSYCSAREFSRALPPYNEARMLLNLTVLPGDGVGPEVTDEAIRVLETIAEAFSHQLISHAQAGRGRRSSCRAKTHSRRTPCRLA